MAPNKCHRKKNLNKNISTPIEIQPTNNARKTTGIRPVLNPPTNVRDQRIADPTRFRKDLLYRKLMTCYQNASNFTSRIQNGNRNFSTEKLHTHKSII